MQAFHRRSLVSDLAAERQALFEEGSPTGVVALVEGGARENVEGSGGGRHIASRPSLRQALLGESPRLIVVPPLGADPSQVRERVGQAVGITELPEDSGALPQCSECGVVVTLTERHPS